MLDWTLKSALLSPMLSRSSSFQRMGNFLCFPVGSDAKLSLQDICNLNVQLETIRRHVFLYDVDDVFNIVTPVDLNSNKLTGEVRNLFQDF